MDGGGKIGSPGRGGGGDLRCGGPGWRRGVRLSGFAAIGWGLKFDKDAKRFSDHEIYLKVDENLKKWEAK